MGCNGGTIDAAFKHTSENGAMQLKDYPYSEKENACNLDKSKAEKVNSGYYIINRNATATMEALQYSPVAALMQVNRAV